MNRRRFTVSYVTLDGTPPENWFFLPLTCQSLDPAFSYWAVPWRLLQDTWPSPASLKVGDPRIFFLPSSFQEDIQCLHFWRWELEHWGCVDLCVCLLTCDQVVCVCLHVDARECASVSPCCWRLSVRSSCIAVPSSCRRPHGAGHRGNHGGDPPVAPGDEGLQHHMRATGPIREPGACLFTMGGGEVLCEQRVSVFTCLKFMRLLQ